MSTRNKSGCGCLPVMGFIALLSVGGVGTYYYFNGFPLSKNTPLQALEVVPQSAFASSYISTNEQDWQQLSQYGTPEAQQAIQKSIDQWKQDTISNSNINFDQDILPWIDGITLAFLTPNSTETQPPILLVVGVKNKFKAADFLKKLETQPGVTQQEREYQGMTIGKITTQEGQYFYWSLTGNRLIVAQESPTIEQAIDTFKGNPSYAENSQVKELFSQPLTVKNSLIQVYIPEYKEVIKQAIIHSNRNLSESSLQELNTIQSVVIGMGAETEGLHLQAIAKLTPQGAVNNVTQTIDDQLTSEFPGNTLAFINVQGIKQGWSQLLEKSSQNTDINNLITQIREGTKTVNLDADQDIFAWMDGEFALGIINLEKGGIANFGLGGMMMIETSDRATGEQTLNKLTEIAKSNPFIKSEQRQVGGTDVTEWTMAQQGVIFSYGWLNNQSLMVTLGTSLDTIKQLKDQQSLPDNPNFKVTKAVLPNNNLGYFYMDIGQVTYQLSTIPGTFLTPEAKTILSSIQGLGMTATSPNELTSQVDMFLTLKSGK